RIVTPPTPSTRSIQHIQQDPATLHLEALVRIFRPLPYSEPEDSGGLPAPVLPVRDLLQLQLQLPVDAPRMTNVPAHPVRRIRTPRRAGQPGRSPRGSTVRQPVQRVVVPLMPVVQKASHPI